MNKLKFTFVALLVSMFAVYFSGHLAFAGKKGSSSEVIYNDGKFGLSRTSNVSSQGKVTGPLLAETPILNLHAAYTSYTDEFKGDSYWAFLSPNNIFIFGAFSTKQGTLTGVRVRWKIKNTDVPTRFKVVDVSHDFSEIVVTPDDFWTAWLQIPNDLVPDGLVPGLYQATVTVESLEDFGKKSAKCTFTVIPGNN